MPGSRLTLTRADDAVMTTNETAVVNVLRDLIDKWQTRNGDGRSTLVGGGRTDCIHDLITVLRTQYDAEPWSYVVRVETSSGPRWLGSAKSNDLVESIDEARLWNHRRDAEPSREVLDRAHRATIEKVAVTRASQAV